MSLQARKRISAAASCSLGVGCNETGMCYATAIGQPDRCGKPRGRPPVAEADRLHIYNIRLTRAQIEKLALLGGAAWIRERINRARKP